LPSGSSEPFVLEPRRRSTQVLQVGTRTTGTFPIRVDVLTSDGAEGITHGEVVLVSTAFNRVALVLSGGAAGFLLLGWRRGRRRAARDREASA
jgi:membrane glycosyltransferase